MPFIKAKNLTNHTKIIPCPFCGESEEIAVEGYTTEAGLRWRIVCCNYMATSTGVGISHRLLRPGRR